MGTAVSASRVFADKPYAERQKSWTRVPVTGQQDRCAARLSLRFVRTLTGPLLLSNRLVAERHAGVDTGGPAAAGRVGAEPSVVALPVGVARLARGTDEVEEEGAAGGTRGADDAEAVVADLGATSGNGSSSPGAVAALWAAAAAPAADAGAALVAPAAPGPGVAQRTGLVHRGRFAQSEASRYPAEDAPTSPRSARRLEAVAVTVRVRASKRSASIAYSCAGRRGRPTAGRRRRCAWPRRCARRGAGPGHWRCVPRPPTGLRRGRSTSLRRG
jgi:hypothetical protein